MTWLRRLMAADKSWGPDPDHPILPRAFEYEIVALHLQKEPPDGSEPYLELTLKRGSERRLLRFWSPQDLEVERGGPAMTSGFQILDISRRGLEHLGVRVTDFEASHGAVHFVARSVEDRGDAAG